MSVTSINPVVQRAIDLQNIAVKDDDIRFDGDDQIFHLLPEPTQRRFATLKDLDDYVRSEVEIWKSVDNDIANKYDNIVGLIRNIRAQPSGKQSEIERGLSSVRNMLKTWEMGPRPRLSTCIASESPFGQFLLNSRKRYNSEDDYKNAAYYFSIGISQNPHSSLALTPYSIEKVVMGVMVKWADLLFGEQALKARECLIDKFQSRLVRQDDIYSEQNRCFEDRMTSLKNQADSNASEFRSQMESQSKGFEDLTSKINVDAEDLRSKYKERIHELENTYTRKLQLEGPADYWERLARINFWKGFVYAALSSTCIVALAIMAYSLLAEADILPIFNVPVEKINLGTIRASLMLLIFTSAWAYVIHLLTRLAISSFHLHRDYTERFQLTRVYLALLKNDSLMGDAGLRNIVMQSLFCRSDTGLLKNEGGIKMPVMDIMGKTSGE